MSMQPFETQAVINKDGMIVVAMPFPVGETVKIVAVPADDENTEDREWQLMSLRRFLDTSPDEDSVYDAL